MKFLFVFLVAQILANPVLIVIGTRPEAVKMIPVYRALQEENVPVLLCSTGQHCEILEQMFKDLDVKPDFEFNIMKPGQDLFHITEAVLQLTKKLYLQVNPSLVLVQGDTSTAMAAALAAFYLKISVGHVEAGVRSGNRDRPFPEEMNRKTITLLANHHFAPTQKSVNQLLREGVDRKTIYLTGNTVVDALQEMRRKLDCREFRPSEEIRSFFEANQKVLLLTAHRRESIPHGLHHIFTAVCTALQRNPNLAVIYPVHPNPAIHKVLEESGLLECPRIKITPPLGYQDLVFALASSDCVATDSGGIQEEAASLLKPVLVLREETDRPEAIEAGIADLVGTDEEKIVAGIERMVENPISPNAQSIYGDGQAAKRIAKIIKGVL